MIKKIIEICKDDQRINDYANGVIVGLVFLAIIYLIFEVI